MFNIFKPRYLVLVLTFLHSTVALKLFSPSSIGTRYFDSSQIGIITTDYDSDKPQFNGKKHFQHTVEYHSASYHSPSYHSPNKFPSSSLSSHSHDSYLSNQNSFYRPSLYAPQTPQKVPFDGGVILNKPSYNRPSVVTSKPVVYTYKPVIMDIPMVKPTTKRPSFLDKIKPIFTNNKKPACDCKCGYKHEAFKVDNMAGPQNIIGGSEAHLNEYPWIVRLATQGRTFCGGALINANYVLTAAHCVSSRKKEQMQAVIGDHDQTITSDAPSVAKPISAILMHESYDKQNYTNDIALLRLSSPVVFSNNIQPVCLPTSDMDPPARIGEIAGWGRTTEKGKGSNKILKVDVPILSQKECREKKIRPARITDTMLCAGEANKDSCQGDSGGPLIVQNPVKGKHEVHGVVSWGIGCGRDGYPGIYTRVSKYMDWLQRKMSDACLCT